MDETEYEWKITKKVTNYLPISTAYTVKMACIHCIVYLYKIKYTFIHAQKLTYV